MSTNNFDQLVVHLISMTDSSVPPWTLTLISWFKGLFVLLRCINELVKNVDNLQSFNSIQKTVTDNLAAENARLNNEIQILTKRVDDDEQRERNNCFALKRKIIKISIIGIITNDFGLNIFRDNIQRSHRFGPKISKRNTRSTVIFRLVRYRRRKEVFKRNY